jgi:glycine dehydrogenase subunit 2
MLIFEKSHTGRRATSQAPQEKRSLASIPEHFRRKQSVKLPEVSELQAVRHYTQLSQKNFSIDTHFYPLGSCTMKYNPRGAQKYSMLPGIIDRHPLAPTSKSQGFLSCMFELQEILKDITGMTEVSLAPMAGAQGEFSGVRMIRAYHEARNDLQRTEILITDSAHGTNPATAAMCGYKVREIPTDSEGDVDLDAFREMIGPHTAGMMMTNPSTLGVFEKNIDTISHMVHEVGGLLYYDGANLNALLGKVKPGEMGFDVMHMNLHKTFATPHGGGGPGSGPIGVNKRLLPYMPIPHVVRQETEQGFLYQWQGRQDHPDSIGCLSAFGGNAGILVRAYIYARLLGREGLNRVGEYATLNANYMLTLFKEAGFEVAFPERRATHEFIVSLKREARDHGVTAMDFAKRLLDLGYHAPTTYFPLLIPECLLIEPTETESKNEMDGFIAAMKQILAEAQNNAEQVTSAPFTMPVKRLDDVKAARELDLSWDDDKPPQQ